MGMACPTVPISFIAIHYKLPKESLMQGAVASIGFLIAAKVFLCVWTL